MAETLGGTPARMLRALDGARAPARALAANHAAMLFALRTQLVARPVLRVGNDLLDYLRMDMANLRHEEFRVLYLNAGRRLIAEDVMARGSVDICWVDARTVIARALELGAVGLYLVHNHPSGVATPSQDDRRLTERISRAGQYMGIAVYDHIIVARDGCETFMTSVRG